MAKNSLNSDGLVIQRQDLSAVNPGTEDDGRLYNHDGSSSISLTTGSTSSNKGYYMWDEAAGAWHPMKMTVSDADLLDGLDSTDFVQADGSVAMTGTLDIASGNINLADSSFQSIQKQGTHRITVGDTYSRMFTGGASNDFVSLYSNYLGDEILQAIANGDVDVPNGALSEQGNRVATRALERKSVTLTHAEWESGLSSEEVYRFVVPSGETFYLQKIELRQKGGGSSTSMDVDVYDSTAAASVGSTTLGSQNSGDPIGTVAGGNTVLVRLTNSTGGPVTASLEVSGYIV